MIVLGIVVVSYLIGSIPFAVIVSRLFGLDDPRSYGSKNPGATNVLRSGNKLAALLTLIGDCLKGVFAILLVKWVGGRFFDLAPWMLSLAGLCVFIGHLYPVFLKFKGGKGVATGLGVLLALEPALAGFVALTWVVIAFVFGYSSLAAILSALFAPLYYLLGDPIFWRLEPSVVIVVTLIGLLLLYRHMDNINKLIQGKESKIGRKKHVHKKSH